MFNVLDFSSQNASLYPITFGWLIEAKILTSFTLFSCCFLDNFSKMTDYRAYIRLSIFLVTRFTEPKEPFPKTLSILKSSSVVEVIFDLKYKFNFYYIHFLFKLFINNFFEKY